MRRGVSRVEKARRSAHIASPCPAQAMPKAVAAAPVPRVADTGPLVPACGL